MEAFLAAVVLFFAGPLARRSARSSKARSGVIVSGSSSRRNEALVVPSVTYGPKRPSLSRTVTPVTGSAPSSRRGSFWAAPRRRFGWANSSCASWRVTVKICASLSSDRESLPRLR